MSAESDVAGSRPPAGSRHPGTEDPRAGPPEDEPEVQRVPDSELPDVDDEGHMDEKG